MKLTINGQLRELAPVVTLAGLLEALGLDSRTVVVERNREIAWFAPPLGEVNFFSAIVSVTTTEVLPGGTVMSPELNGSASEVSKVSVAPFAWCVESFPLTLLFIAREKRGRMPRVTTSAIFRGAPRCLTSPRDRARRQRFWVRASCCTSGTRRAFQRRRRDASDSCRASGRLASLDLSLAVEPWRAQAPRRS